MNRLHSFSCVASLALASALSVQALEIHVALNGSDRGSGSPGQPVQTLRKAQELVRQSVAESPGESVTVILGSGGYRIDRPLEFGPDDVSPSGADVTWRSAEPGGATISGGRVLSGWTEHEDGSWSVQLAEVRSGDWFTRELFVNGERRPRARTPNEGYFRIEQAAPDRRTGFTFEAGDLRAVPDLDQVELVFLHDWSITRVGVQTIDEQSRKLVAQNNIGANASHYAIDHFEEHPRYFLENSKEYLDQPGEWYVNRDSGRLRYLPKPGETPSNTEVIVPVAGRLLEVRGTPQRPVRNLHFNGIHFEHCAWQIPENGYAEGQANYHEPRTEEQGILREIIPAAIQFELAEDCSIRNSRIAHLGSGGVWFGSRCHNNLLENTLVTDVSGNGVLLGEDRGRSVPEGAWWQAAPEQAASNNIVRNCVIERCGQQFFGAVGIWVGLTRGSQILDNTIRWLPYTGVSLGWMWSPTPTPCRENIVVGNHIHHVMQVLSDGGGIYTLGLQPGTRLQDNRIHDVPVNLGRAESNGMFLDEGTTGITVENNVIYNISKSPLRFHRATTNLVKNNLLVVKPGTPHIRYNNTEPEDISQEGNVIAEEVTVQP